ncbi:hypothetical protein ACTJJE_05885 [Mycolicibacterium sp. 22603]|uniref:AbiTii domain-containing protein n=1 Tax=Mycolicibacterium sp. 22603 TaxID=3453950 RepID=UPI003F8355D2
MPNRRAVASQLSEELLTDFELSRIGPAELVRKSSRLARLLDDDDAMGWLSIEISGFDPHRTESGLTSNAWSAAVRSQRVFVDDDGQKKARTPSVGQLAAMVESAKIRLAASSDAPISVTSANPYQTVGSPTGNARERGMVQGQISNNQALLDRVLGAIHEYVSERHVELRFGDAVESSFTRVREHADGALVGLVPEAASKLSAAFELVASDNPEHWSDAAAYCRKLIIAIADKLVPPGTPLNGGRANGAENYVNRLVHWVQEQQQSGTRQDVIVSDLQFYGTRIDAFVDAGNKGAHAAVTREDADRFIVGTYILLSDIVMLAPDGMLRPADVPLSGSYTEDSSTLTEQGAVLAQESGEPADGKSPTPA